MKRLIWLSALAVALFATLVSIETIRSDEPFSLADLALDLFETGLLAVAVAMTAYVSLATRDMRRERAGLLDDLARARAEGEAWRSASRAHIDGLSQAIREQFALWELSPGEADVAILMLKGLSHKEIARLRNTTSATVRQQAANVYRKSGLVSRADLSAYFLEDLLAPSPRDRDEPRVGLVRSRE
jgi:DNA-binding CsgD family transcriptional regulator